MPVPVAAGKAKAQKGEGAQSEAGFASLLAAMVVPGQVQGAPVVLPVGEGSGQPGESPVGNGLPAGAQMAWTVVQNTPAAVNAQVPETAPAPPFAQALADAAGATPGQPGTELPAAALVEEGAAPMPEEAAGPALVGGLPAGTDQEIADPAEGQPPVPVGELPEPAETQPESPGQQRNPRANDPDLTRGLERAAQVSKALENRPADAPNADKFPLNRVQQSEPTPDPVDPIPEPVEPTPSVEGPAGQSTSPVESHPVQPSAAERPQPEAQAAQQNSPLHRLNGRYEPPRLMDEIARALAQSEDGNYSLTLRLHPENLGEVRLQLQMSGREITAAMQVANADARQLLENQAHQLRQNLSQAGLTLTGFQVSTGQQQQQLRDRRGAFDDASLESRRTQPVGPPAPAAVSKGYSTERRGGRLDTMA